jgi:hypothetical protein
MQCVGALTLHPAAVIGKNKSMQSLVAVPAGPLAVCIAAAALLALGTAANAACAKGRFALQGPFAVDRQAGLVWQRCSVGSEWKGGKCEGMQQAMSLSEAKASIANDKDWRLPTADELAGLIDQGCGTPSIDTRVFPNLVDDGEGAIPYWSSSPAGVGRLMTFVDFANARVDWHSPGFALFVRLVKSAPGPAPR